MNATLGYDEDDFYSDDEELMALLNDLDVFA